MKGPNAQDALLRIVPVLVLVLVLLRNPEPSSATMTIFTNLQSPVANSRCPCSIRGSERLQHRPTPALRRKAGKPSGFWGVMHRPNVNPWVTCNSVPGFSSDHRSDPVGHFSRILFATDYCAYSSTSTCISEDAYMKIYAFFNSVYTATVDRG